MAKKWNEVAASPEFQSLNGAEKRDARDEYFRDVVAPQVPAQEQENAWKEFYTDTNLREDDDFVTAVTPKKAPEGFTGAAAGGLSSIISTGRADNYLDRVDELSREEATLRGEKINGWEDKALNLFDQASNTGARYLTDLQYATTAIPSAIARSVFDNPEESLQTISDEGDAQVRENAPFVGDPSSFKGIVSTASQSLPQQIPGIALSVVTKKPRFAVGMGGAQAFGQEAGDMRRAGADPYSSQLAGIGYGAAEAIGEKLPMDALLKTNVKYATRLGAVVINDALGESVTQTLQSAIDKGTLNPDLTLEEALEQIGIAAGAGALTGGAIATVAQPFIKNDAPEGMTPPATETNQSNSTPLPPTAPPPPPAAPIEVSTVPTPVADSGTIQTPPAPAQPPIGELEQVLASDRPVADIIAENDLQGIMPGEIEMDSDLGEGTGSTGKVYYNPETGTFREAGAIASPNTPANPAKVQTATDVVKATAVAASSPLNSLPEPTPAQKEAGNYKKGHVNIQGLNVAIETPRDGKRTGQDADGNKWEVQMPADYGYIKRTIGADDEQVDTYIGQNPQSDRVFVIDQIDPKTGKFDEHKAFIGFDDQAAAEAAYDAAFNDGSGEARRHAVTEMAMPDFKVWLKGDKVTRPVGQVPLSPAQVNAKVGQVPSEKLETLISTTQTKTDKTSRALAAAAQTELAKRKGLEPTNPIRRSTVKSDVAVTPSGKQVDVEYAVVDADDLIASQNDAMQANPAYPAELQPRDRTRAASENQVNQIAANLNPMLLGEQPLASEGAPIIAESGVVESGNGRVLAIKQAYRKGRGAIEKYTIFLKEKGYNTEGMSKPVLVRIRKTPMAPQQRLQFTREANERTTASLSSTERAQSDAKSLPAEVLSLYSGGDITQARNRDFAKAFIRVVVNASDQPSMIGTDGSISQDAVKRINAALFAKAYSDNTLLERIFESTDDTLRSLGKALVDVSGPWAQMRAEAESGDIAAEVDITDSLVEAVKIILNARENGRSVTEFLGQGDIFSGEANPEVELLAKLMFSDTGLKRMLGREKIAQMLGTFVAEARKTSPKPDLLGQVVTVDQVLSRLEESTRDERRADTATEASLFDAARQVPAENAGSVSAIEPASEGQERQEETDGEVLAPEAQPAEEPADSVELDLPNPDTASLRQLFNLQKRLEKAFTEETSLKPGDPKAVTDEQFAAMEAYARKVERLIEEKTAAGEKVIPGQRKKAPNPVEAKMAELEVEHDTTAPEPRKDEIKGEMDILADKRIAEIKKKKPAPKFQRQTETEAFKSWFGNSKVVDADGNPKVMYHNSSADADFSKFKLRIGDIGIHFGTIGQANDRGDYMRPAKEAKSVPGFGRLNIPMKDAYERTIPVYLSIKNPLRLPDAGMWNRDNLEYSLRDIFPKDSDVIRKLKSTKDIREFIQLKGYDGVVYKNTGEVKGSAPYLEARKTALEAMIASQKSRGKSVNGFDKEDQETPEYKAYKTAYDSYEKYRDDNAEDSYIAFQPAQIKSAIGNDGNFDAKNPDIRFQREYTPTPDAPQPQSRLRVKQVANWTEQKKQIQEEMQKAFKKVYGDRKIELVEKILDSDGKSHPGAFDPDALVVYIALNTTPDGRTGTIGHEGIHLLRTLGVFTAEEWSTLSAQAKSEWIDKYKIRSRYAADTKGMSEADAEQIYIEEAVAEAQAAFTENSPLKATIARIFRKLKRFTAFLKSGLRDRGIRSAEDILADVRAGKYAKKADASEVAGDDSAPKFARAPETEAFKRWFGKSKVVDADGNPLRMYRGDFRADKIGNTFRILDEDEGGSGGIYFTDNPDIAAGYANKNYYDAAFDDVLNHTDVKLNGKSVPLTRANAFLRPAQKAKIEEAVLSVGEHDGYNGINSEDPMIGRSTWQDYLQRNAGNYVKAADDVLVRAGTLDVDDYVRFWREVGVFEQFMFDSPADPQPATTPVFLSIQNPLDVYNVSKETLKSLEKKIAGDITLTSLNEAIEKGHARTISYVTPEFRKAAMELGFDGVKDIGGRQMGFDDHTVFIAFKSEQIKSAVGNSGAFDANNPDIRFQRRNENPTSFRQPDIGIFDVLRDDSLTLLEKFKKGVSLDVIGVSIDERRRIMQDRMLPYMRTQNNIEKIAGRKLSPDEDVYQSEELFTGRVGEKLLQLDKNHLDPLLNAIATFTNKVNNGKNIIEDYLYAKHAKERNAQIQKINPKFTGKNSSLLEEGKEAEGGSGMTDAQADAILEKAKADGHVQELDAIAERVYKMLGNALDERVKMGLISEDTAKKLRSTYKNYVPLRGQAELGIEPGNNTGSGYSLRGQETKRALGRESKAQDLLANVIGIAQEAIIRGEKNKVGQALRNLVENNPDEDLWEINKVESKPVLNKATGLVEYRTTPYPSGFKPNDDTVFVKDKGETYRVTLKDKRLAAPMLNLEMHNVDALIRGLATINRYLSSLNTTWDPQFVVTNALRDIQTAGINIQQHQLKGLATATFRDYGKALRGSWGGVRGQESTEWQKYFREFAAAGGRVSFFNMDNLQARRKKLEKEIARRKDTGWAATKRGARGMVEWVELMNQSVDNAIRLSAYVNARRLGLSEADAATLAKNLTVNFNKRGELGPKMNALYLFYNASVQGTFVMLKALKSRRVQKLAAAVVAAGFSEEMMNAWLSPDDDDGEPIYDKIPQYEKEGNIIFMDPTGKLSSITKKIFNTGEQGGAEYIKIPAPYGYRVFKEIGRNIAAVSRGAEKPTQAAANIGWSAANSFNPVGGGNSFLNLISPTVLDPWVDLAQNRDWSGKSILPAENPFDKTPPPDSQRFYPSASKISVETAQKLNEITGGDEFVPGAVDVSPETLDYIFRQYTGAAGTFVGKTVDVVNKGFSGQELQIGQIPFVRKVLGETPVWLDKSLAYDRMHETQLAYDRYSTLMKTGQKERAKASKENDKHLLELYGKTKSTTEQLKAYRKQRQSIEANDKLPEEIKKQKLEKNLTDEAKIVNSFNRKYLETMGKIKKESADDTLPSE